jgi:hypothetical protein
MARPKDFQTTDIDLAAAIMTATGSQPGIVLQPGQTLVTFEFEDDETSRSIIIAYATGELRQSVKRFAACRAWLYRQTKGVQL